MMSKFRTPETDHETIWLEPECCGEGNEFGRTWCPDDAWETCEDGVGPSKYIRADIATDARASVIRECAAIARNACLVPPDGGSPTEEEQIVCEAASKQILALLEDG